MNMCLYIETTGRVLRRRILVHLDTLRVRRDALAVRLCFGLGGDKPGHRKPLLQIRQLLQQIVFVVRPVPALGASSDVQRAGMGT